MNVAAIVQRAYNWAREADESMSTPAALHRARSARFVSSLVEIFRDIYRDQANVVVLSRQDPMHREAFGLNELLHDILVCETSTTRSARGLTSLTCVGRPLWQVESEFDSSSREAIKDFNKLVLGSAEQKLFIGPRNADQLRYLRTLAAGAKQCKGDIYVSLVPHPRAWSKHPVPLVHSFRWDGQEWVSSAPKANV